MGRFVRRYGDLIAADDAQSEGEMIERTGGAPAAFYD